MIPKLYNPCNSFICPACTGTSRLSHSYNIRFLPPNSLITIDKGTAAFVLLFDMKTGGSVFWDRNKSSISCDSLPTSSRQEYPEGWSLLFTSAPVCRYVPSESLACLLTFRRLVYWPELLEPLWIFTFIHLFIAGTYVRRIYRYATPTKPAGSWITTVAILLGGRTAFAARSRVLISRTELKLSG